MGLEILLEGRGFCFIAEGSGNFDLPRSVCLRAWCLSPIMFGKSRFKVPCEADVVMIRFDRASKDIDVVETHGLLRRGMSALAERLQFGSGTRSRENSCEVAKPSRWCC